MAGALARRGRTAGDLSTELGLPAVRVRRHLSRLTAAGVVKVEDNRRSYRLDAEAIRSAAREASPSRDPGLALGAVYDDEGTVLRHYFRGGRLTEVPAKHSKRLVALRRLALEFDPGVRYPEREVNRTLRRFHEDYAALRRHLVDEGFLSRERGEYRRSGGPVEI